LPGRRPEAVRTAWGALWLLAALGLYFGSFARFDQPPAEDAAMLLRYAENVAAGNGIVWNVGEPPLDGATDFLFLLGVAGLHRLGLTVEAAARALGLLALVLAVLVVYVVVRRRYGAGQGVALFSAAALAAGPGLHFVDVTFGTTFFALTVALAFGAARALAAALPDKLGRRALVFSATVLFMGLARPEGVFIGVFLLGAVLFERRGEGAATILRAFVLLFGLLGLAYFLWRWSYFGHPLPNPFYRKSGGALHWGVIRRTFGNLVRQGGPFLVVLAAGLFVPRARRAALFGLIPIACFGVLWVLVSDETVEYLRYSYAILPVMVMAWVPVGQVLASEIARRLGPDRVALRSGLVVAAFALGVALVVWQHRRFERLPPGRVGLYDVGTMLGAYRAKGYSMAVTEAGLLPLYSGWRAVDAWGLNDRYIARYGTVTDAYLDRYRPEVIVFHAYFSPGLPDTGDKVERRGFGKPWHEMVMALKSYAERRGYRLAAVFGRDPYDTHYYYVRTAFEDSEEIAKKIAATPYYWDGAPTENYVAAE
jgi:arabinofuranosyltransferase